MKLQWQNFPHDVPGNRPLHPMPKAGRDAVVNWLHRVRSGVLVSLALGVLGLGLYLAGRPWSGEPVPEWSRWTSYLASPVALVAVWLITTPEPGNGAWLRRHRWIIRIGVITSWVFSILTLVLEGRPGSQSQSQPSLLVSLWALVWIWSITFAVSYDRELAERLKDSLLRKNYTVLLWGAVIIAAGFSVSFIMPLTGHWTEDAEPADPAAQAEPGEADQADEPDEAKEADEADQTSLHVFTAIMGGIAAWAIWLRWRLARRLGKAARKFLPPADNPQPADDY